MFETIVWATDGSAAADLALPFAKALAECGHGKLVVVHSRERMIGGRSHGYPVLADEEALEAKIHGQFEELRAEGVEATLEIVSGPAPHAAHRIADEAQELHADVIVVGTRGHGPVAGLLMGSVTQRLLHIAPCPVLAVPTGKQAPVEEPKLEAAEAAR